MLVFILLKNKLHIQRYWECYALSRQFENICRCVDQNISFSSIYFRRPNDKVDDDIVCHQRKWFVECLSLSDHISNRKLWCARTRKWIKEEEEEEFECYHEKFNRHVIPLHAFASDIFSFSLFVFCCYEIEASKLHFKLFRRCSFDVNVPILID